MFPPHKYNRYFLVANISCQVFFACLLFLALVRLYCSFDDANMYSFLAEFWKQLFWQGNQLLLQAKHFERSFIISLKHYEVIMNLNFPHFTATHFEIINSSTNVEQTKQSSQKPKKNPVKNHLGVAVFSDLKLLIENLQIRKAGSLNF